MVIIQKHMEFFLQYYRDKQAVNDDGEITDFAEASATDLVGLKN